MEMPDWLSGFTPSEQEPVKATQEQPGPSTENISPADLPSWVQAMRPIESVMSGAQSDDEDQTVENGLNLWVVSDNLRDWGRHRYGCWGNNRRLVRAWRQ